MFENKPYEMAYGISGTEDKKSSWFPGSFEKGYYEHHNGISRECFIFKEGEVDMLLDADEGELKFCVVGLLDDDHEAKIYNLPKQTCGWVPHFYCYCDGTEFRIAKISVDLYGKSINDMFP